MAIGAQGALVSVDDDTTLIAQQDNIVGKPADIVKPLRQGVVLAVAPQDMGTITTVRLIIEQIQLVTIFMVISLLQSICNQL
ncbi:MAG: hypothetical protein WC913_02690 [Desulfuromonas sp.]